MNRLFLLHSLNHILTSRSRIHRHNRLLKDQEKTEREDKLDNTEGNEKWRDQGFTRPTVLVLLPTRGVCYKFVQQLFDLIGCQIDADQAERFENDYGVDPSQEEPNHDDENERRRKLVLQKKGPEWNELFGDDVNPDDDFKMGIGFTPKAAKGNSSKKVKGSDSNVLVKLYTDFYKSDMIIASPLALKMLTTPEDETKEGDTDYLSSIEICLVGYADVLMMQNWDHVNDILNFLNQQPKNNNDTDFSRVRNYLLDGQGCYWRQLIVSSDILDPCIQSTFKRFGKSFTGSAKFRRRISPEDASISNVLVPIKQVFQRVSATSFDTQIDARITYFTKTILPEILRQKQKHTMIFIPSYFDFCALRNVLLKKDVSFVSVTEYSRTSEVTRGRAWFLQGRKPLMLYTGRCHFFHRHVIKGVRHLIFFGVPEHSHFYSDHVNLIQTVVPLGGGDTEEVVDRATTVASCLVLFTKYDAHSLERIVGSANCNRMVSSEKTTFMFYA